MVAARAVMVAVEVSCLQRGKGFCHWSGVCSQDGVPGESFHCRWEWWWRLWASFFPDEGTIEGHLVHAAQGSQGENLVLFGRATTAPLAFCPS
jgi:hypothetical protein